MDDEVQSKEDELMRIPKQWNSKKRYTIETTPHVVRKLIDEYGAQASYAASCGDSKLHLRILREQVKLLEMLEDEDKNEDDDEEEELTQKGNGKTDLRKALRIHG